MSNDFEQTFRDWAKRSLAQKIPSEVRAFSFNLYETGVDLGVEPVTFSGETWEQCLVNMRKLVCGHINSNEGDMRLLKSPGGKKK